VGPIAGGFMKPISLPLCVMLRFARTIAAPGPGSAGFERLGHS
jgi:hypothetical protein